MQERLDERIEFIGGSEQTLFDLSKGGLSCLAQRKFEKNKLITATVNDLSLTAKVVYCIERADGFRTGVQFWNVPQDRKKQLDELIDKFSRGVPMSCTVRETQPGK